MFNRDEFYTTEEFEKKTGFPRETVWRWCRENKISNQRIGRTFIIPKTKENESFAKEKMTTRIKK